MVLRSLQGVLECTVSPTFMLITGAWYTSDEHTHRSIIWGTGNAGMSVLTNLICYGIAFRAQKNPSGPAPWRDISFFLGGLTMFLAVMVFFFLGTPREVSWLSERERRMAAARVVRNKTGSDRQKRSEWKWDQVRTTFRDPQTYLLFFTIVANTIPNGGTTTFGNLVYKSFGFTSLETLLEGSVPQQAVSVLWFLFVGYCTLKRPNLRCGYLVNPMCGWSAANILAVIFMVICLIPAFIGMMVLAFLPKNGHLWLRWGMFLMTVTGNLPGLLIWTILPSNIAGRTKKSVTSAILFIAYCTGNAIGAQVFQAKDAPRYITGLTVCAIFYGVETVLMLTWRYYCE